MTMSLRLADLNLIAVWFLHYMYGNSGLQGPLYGDDDLLQRCTSTVLLEYVQVSWSSPCSPNLIIYVQVFPVY